jgi:2-keto-3-deoxy-L-rhamnonate aldolase RhmA
MGLPGRSDHPDVQAAVAEARKKVLAGGKVLIGEPADLASARQMIADGILLISTVVQEMWVNTTRAYLKELKEEGKR